MMPTNLNTYYDEYNHKFKDHETYSKQFSIVMCIMIVCYFLQLQLDVFFFVVDIKYGLGGEIVVNIFNTPFGVFYFIFLLKSSNLPKVRSVERWKNFKTKVLIYTGIRFTLLWILSIFHRHSGFT